MRNKFSLCGVMLVAVLGPFFGSARADLVVPPPPECVGKADGTFCQLGDGTAGKCATTPDGRRPGRSYITCAKDNAECDRLTIGAECHGYLGKPAHCKEFNDPEKKKTWRTCQVDEGSGASADSSAAHSASPVAAESASTATPTEKKKGRFGCSAAPGAAGPLGMAGYAALSLMLAAIRLRRKK